nr:hypothetical protein [Mycobacterium lepraemurium]
MSSGSIIDRDAISAAFDALDHAGELEQLLVHSGPERQRQLEVGAEQLIRAGWWRAVWPPLRAPAPQET